jgi:SAM-dependent methyltransferase
MVWGMKTVKYDNTAYWTNLYKKHESMLRAAGHPTLSEKLNELKYSSEAKTFLRTLEEISQTFRQTGREELSIQDVGTGFGYWAKLVHRYFTDQGFRVEVTGLDISQKALDVLHKDSQFIRTVQDDLKTVDPEKFSHKFDLVISCYCLHHLVNLDDFLNALRFVGKSVNLGGFLVIMDPVLTLPYSKFDVLDFASFQGNGIPRHLYILEDILDKEGFKREIIKPAVSFLLNGNIEGHDWLTYGLASIIWRTLCTLVYKSESVVRLISGVLVALDQTLKRLNLAFGSKVCVYRKLPAKAIRA